METAETAVHPAGVPGVGPLPSGEALGPLGALVAALFPPGDGYWELHCHCTHDEAGCTDLHLHTCRTRRTAEPSPAEPAAHGAYL